MSEFTTCTEDKPAAVGSCYLPGAEYYWHRKRQMVLDLIATQVRDLKLQPNPRIFVDLGCGEGVDLEMVAAFFQANRGSGNAEKQEWKCIGIDGFAPSLEKCRARLASRALNEVEIISANIFKPLGLTDASVDLLYCSEVIEHIPNPESFLSEIRRVLKVGGLALITTPNEPNLFQRSWWSASRRAEVRRRLGDGILHRCVEPSGEVFNYYGHISLLTNRQLDRLMDQFGLRLVDFRRGAVVYGGQRWLNLAPVHFTRLAFEGMLDLLPRRMVRNISDQIIGLYRKTA